MEDRVTILPDELLCHILSFLPTKEAIATTILSKRWTNLWRSVSTLDFNDSTYGGDKHSRFIQSVYAVLLSRNLNQPIKKFRLRCSIRPSLLDSDYASFWVDAVLQRRAEHIDISLPFVSPIRVHSNLCFFNCRTLVVLKLKGLGLNLKHFSSVVELPLVKVLHMQTVLLPDCGSFADILTGCPVLEDLKARNLYFTKYDNEREFNILPKLVRAEISWEPLDIFMVKLVNNVNFLRIRDIDFRLLPYGGEDIDMFHNLTRVELVYTGHTRDWLDVVEFLKYCPKLQVLVIKQPQVDGYYTVGELRGNDWQYPSSVPKCILFHLKECYLNNYRGTKGEFKFARYIMRNGRFLKKMTICKCTAVKQLGKPNDIKKLFSCSARSATCKLYFKI